MYVSHNIVLVTGAGHQAGSMGYAPQLVRENDKVTRH